MRLLLTTNEVGCPCCAQSHPTRRQLSLFYSRVQFWSLDAQLQKKQCFDAVAAVVADHIRHEAFSMPSLQQCLEALSHLRTRAAQPLAVVGRETPSSRISHSDVVRAGLRFRTFGAVTRISEMSASAAQAGAQVGDAVFEIGGANVWGVSAKDVGQFLVGAAGADGWPRPIALIIARYHLPLPHSISFCHL